MWNKTVLLILGTLAFVYGQGDRYLPPNNAYLPSSDLELEVDDPSLDGAAAGDNLALSRPTIQADSAVAAPAEEHNHDHDHDHHHEHWDLRESIPGEPGSDYPLHHRVPEHDFSCNGRMAGYYADVSAGCQAFHVCRGEDLPVESFLCPNGTIFHQKLFSCDWWNNVDCAASESSYSLNNEIGIVPPSNAIRMPVQKFIARPIVVSESNENDIQFQSQSSNDVENGREYLTPVTNNRRPVEPAYSGPSPAFQAPRTQRPPSPARTTPRPAITQARIQPTQAPATPRPVTPVRDYLPPFEAQKISPVVQVTQRPVVQPVNRRPVQRVQPQPVATEEYLPPSPTPARPVVQQTRRPVQQTQYIQPQSNIITQQQIRPQPAKSVSRPVQPQRPVITQQRPSFTETDGYNYPNSPSPAFQVPSTTARPFVSQTFVPQTQRTPQIIVTTPAPVRQTFAPVIISTQRQPLIPQQSFSQSKGYNYDRPAVSFPSAPSTTARPFITQTFAPQTQRATQAVITTRAPVRQTFTTPRPVTPQQSFSQSQGYNYDRPAVTFNVPSSTARPVTYAPQTQRTPAQVIFSTQVPIRQTYAPVTTQRPVSVFTQPQPIPQQSFSQSQGYDYQKPAVSFPSPAPQRPQPAVPQQVFIQTQAPIRQTFAPVTTPRPLIVSTQRPIPQQSFSQSQGYDYQKPAVSFPTPAPQRPQPAVPQQVFVQTQAPIRQTFAPVTTPRPVIVSTQRPIPQQSFSQSQGYDYQKPAVSFPTPAPQRPQPAVPQQVFVQTQAPIRQTFAPVTTPRPVIVSTQRPIPQQSFSQSQGYDYQKPAVSFPTPAPQSPQPAAPQQVFVQTQAPIRPTFAPVTTPRPVIVSTQRPIPQQSFSQTQGYDYQKPAVSFPSPAPQRPQQVFIQTEAPIRQTFAPVVTTAKPIIVSTQRPIPQQSFSQSEGYNYQKPAVIFPAPELPQPAAPQQVFIQTQAPIRQTFAPVVTTARPVIVSTQRPIPQQSFSQSEGYNYQKPAVSFPVPERPQPAAPQQVFIQTQAPIRQTFAPVVTTARPVIVSTQRPIPQQSFSQSEGYNYQKPAVSFPVPERPQPAAPQQVFIQTQAPIRQTFAPVVTTARPVIVSTQRPIPQQSFSQSEGYNYQKPAISFNIPSSTARPVITQTFAPPQQTAIPQQVFSQTNGYSYSRPSTSFDLPASAIRLSQSSSQQTAVSSFHHDQDISIQQNNHVLHTDLLNPLSVEVSLSKVYEPPVSAAVPPCQHAAAASRDPLDELRTPVVLGSPAPFAVKASQTVTSFTKNNNEGYSYPKPNVPFITPNNPTLTAKSTAANQQFSQQVQAYNQQFSHDSFIQSYHSAAVGSNAQSHNQGGSASVKEQQHHSSSSSGVLRHDVEIVPSISYAFQLHDTSNEVYNAKDASSKGYQYNAPAAA